MVEYNDVSEGHPSEHRNLTVLTGLRSVVEVMSQFHMKSVFFVASGNQIFYFYLFNVLTFLFVTQQIHVYNRQTKTNDNTTNYSAKRLTVAT